MCGRDDIPLIVAQGPEREVVYAVRANGERPAKAFLEHLEPRERQRFLASFQQLCNAGSLQADKLKKLNTKRGLAWEFRTHDWRIGAFQLKRRWYLTHGFPKQGQKTPPRQIDQIEKIYDEFIERLEGR